MKIKKLQIKNFKSYGNNLQEITFGDKACLTLLTGNNGAGKSSIRESVDFLFFNKVKKKKKIPIKDLLNRYNDSLYTKIEFSNNKNEDVIIEKSIKPNKLIVLRNNIDISEKFKKFKDEELEDLIGFNYDVFNSFISLSINDFKNFLQLTNEEKRNLLNKLFNLQLLDEYLEITKEFRKDNVKKIEKIRNDIEITNQKVLNLRKLLDNFVPDRENEIIKGNKLLKKLKDEYILKEEELKKLEEDIKTFNKKLSLGKKIKEKNKHEYIVINEKLEEITKKISIYESGICPVCDTSLKDNNHKNKHDDFLKTKSEISESLEDIKNFMDKVIHEETNILNKRDSFIKRKNILSNDLNEIKIEGKNLSNKLKILKNESIKKYELEKDLNNLIEQQIILKEKLEECLNKNKSYDELIEIFKGDYIRQSIIEKVIEPLNKNLTFYLEKLESNLKVKLDNNFNAEIRDNFIINPETVSTGENKKINISIALSYLDLVLSKNYCNIIFLDEIFDGLDVLSIKTILDILKTLTQKYNNNIILVHHSNDTRYYPYFDRIIDVKKKIFSQMNITEIKNEIIEENENING